MNSSCRQAEKEYMDELTKWNIANRLLTTLWKLGIYGEYSMITWDMWRKRE